MSDKPPIGLIPESLFKNDYLIALNNLQKLVDEQVIEILTAINRYNTAGKVIPEDWRAEANYLLDVAIHLNDVSILDIRRSLK